MKKPTILLLTLLLLAALTLPAVGQSSEYRLHVSRDFGYGNGSDVRGNFSIKPYGDLESIQSITYRIDDTPMATVSEAPFVFRFVTSSYPDGWHNLTGQVKTKDGRSITTPPVKLNFISSEQQSSGMQKILIPLLGLIGVIFAVGIGTQFVMTRRGGHPAPGSQRNYGLKGGTICPHCQRPFAIHLFSINLLVGVYDRCPYCGWSGLVRSRSASELRAAEQAEMSAAQSAESGPIGDGAQETEEERVRRMLDQSRYMDQK